MADLGWIDHSWNSSGRDKDRDVQSREPAHAIRRFDMETVQRVPGYGSRSLP